MVSANDKIFDANIERNINVQHYSNGVVRRIRTLLRKVDFDLTASIRKLDEGFTKKRLNEVLSDIRGINKAVHDQIINELNTELKGFAQAEAVFQSDTLSKALYGAVPVVTASDVYSASMSQPFRGRLLSDWASSLEKTSLTRIKDAITIGYTEGQTTQQIINTVIGTKSRGYEDGIISINERNGEAIVRTALSHISNVAIQNTAIANADILKGLQWRSTLDSRTSPICQARDGKIYAIDTRIKPPAHFNCRSRLIPITKSWEELGGKDIGFLSPSKRSSIDGAISSDINYNDWLKGKKAPFQDDVLGATRGKLFRDGGLTLDKFVNNKGKTLTLKELEGRYPSAFDKI